MDKKEIGFATKAIHWGYNPKENNGSLNLPLYQTSTFVFANAEQARARFAGEEEGFIYTRLGSPTVKLLEERIAALEEGEAGIAFASGMGAVSALILGLLKSGDHVITSDALYGGTYAFFEMIQEKFNITFTPVEMTDPSRIKEHLKPETKMLYIETPVNPTMKLIDLEAVALIAKEYNLISAVDNTFMSPYLQQPLTFGIDIVLHSATKYINGHGDVIAGLLAGKKVLVDKIRKDGLKDIGAVLSPFDAWLILRGLKTLPVRMDRHVENAQKVAEYLVKHPKVERVYYPGLPDFPQYELAQKQMKKAGGILSFEVRGGVEAGKKVLNNVHLAQLAVSLGDTETLIQHPASMTHSVIPQRERMKMGITDGLIRLSVGLEDIEDIIHDLDQALNLV